MASRDYTKHLVSTSAPTASNLGDEWYNPTTNRLYKRVATNGTVVEWKEITGTDGSAATLTTARTINGVSFNGSADITIAANTTNALTIGTGLSGTSFNGSSAVTVALATGYGDTLNPYASKTANTFLAAPNGAAGVPAFRAIVGADIPTLNQNTTGTSANVTGTVAVANGGTGAATAAAARTNLGATTVGSNVFTLTNPSAITFPRFNADNTVSSLNAADFRTAIGAGTSSTVGTVTSVGGTGTVSGLTLTGTVTTTGNLTLGGTLAVTASNFASQTANTFLSAPNGSAGVPTFRAIVAADIPTLNQNTTGSAATAGTVTTAAQANITSVGTLTSLAVTGNITSGNVSGTTGAFTNVSGNGIALTAINASNIASGTLAQARLANAAVTLGSTTLTLGATVVTVAGLSSVTSTTFVGALTGAATTAGTVTTAAQPNITSVGTMTAATITTLTTAGITKNGTNGVGNIGASGATFNTVFAKSTSAQYADLAEMYEADQPIDPGYVVCFGGTKEVIMCDSDACTRIAGVISTNPSYLMNSAIEGEHTVAVALTGRVPVRVKGVVRKGDMMVATSDGRARADTNPHMGSVIGKALADFDGDEGVIEVVVGRL